MRPIVWRRGCPRAPRLQLRERQDELPALLRSLQARYGIPAPSPDGRCAPETLSSCPPATFQGPPSCTSSRSLLSRTGHSQTSRPSVPASSDTHARLPLHRCISLPSHLSAPVLPPHPKCRSGY